MDNLENVRKTLWKLMENGPGKVMKTHGKLKDDVVRHCAFKGMTESLRCLISKSRHATVLRKHQLLNLRKQRQ